MSLNLNDLMDKAKAKGISAPSKSSKKLKPTRPWQEESVLFNQTQDDQPPINTEKPATKRQQTDNKPATESATNRQQTDNKIDNKPTTKRKQSGNKKIIDNKPGSKPITKSITNRQQNVNKVATNLSISSLSGLQRSLVICIYQECKKARNKETNPITLEHFSGLVQSSKNTIKTSLQRVEAKGFVLRTNFKAGRGGWSQFSIPDTVYQELMQYETENKLETNWQQSGNKPVTETTTLAPIVSNSSIINTNTMNEEINTIDFSCLSEYGFDEDHLYQIKRAHLNNPDIAMPDKIIQKSIYGMWFDLKYNNIENKLNKPPIVVLVSLLKKGEPYGCTTPDKFLTPQEEAMRRYLEAEEARVNRLKEMEERAKSLEYNSWLEGISEEELLEFAPKEGYDGVPSNVLKTVKRNNALEFSKEYFNAEIWPLKKKEVFSAFSKKEEEVT